MTSGFLFHRKFEEIFRDIPGHNTLFVAGLIGMVPREFGTED